MTKTQSTNLTRRETAKADLLRSITARPGRTKLAVITNDGRWTVPNKTRAGQYKMIDDLIRRVLVENRSEDTSSIYGLHATPAGAAEIERWDSQ